MRLVAHAVKLQGQEIYLELPPYGPPREMLASAPPYGRLMPGLAKPDDSRLVAL